MTFRNHWSKIMHASLAIAALVAVLSGALPPLSAKADQADQPAAPNISNTVFLPSLVFKYPWSSPFGVESNTPLTESSAVFNHTVSLNSRWARMGSQISWSNLQPTETTTEAQIYSNMDAHLGTFENELRSLKAAGISPVVLVKDTPPWAADIDKVGYYTSCGPIHPDKFQAFATFTKLLVRRYSTAEFNVHDWEIGNEPDVDPEYLPLHYLFGCWGDKDDLQYYGGTQYGDMLKVVSPAIRSEDPAARIWLGGLLLSSPNTPEPYGKPENFLRGILTTGAAPHFDIVPYHWHPSYYPEPDPNNPGSYLETTKTDFDLLFHDWEGWGGGVIGKARYLRQLMGEFGVSKPLVLNETGFGCADDNSNVTWCDPPSSMFFSLQADLLVRMAVRGMSQDLSGYMWYTISGPGWRNTGLLNELQQPRPSYNAYKALTQQLDYGNYLGAVNYRIEVEAHGFRRKLERVHVAWTKSDQVVTIQVPDAKFIAAYDLNGVQLNPPLVGSNYEITVGFSPIYIVRKP